MLMLILRIYNTSSLLFPPGAPLPPRQTRYPVGTGPSSCLPGDFDLLDKLRLGSEPQSSGQWVEAVVGLGAG